ncbi:phenylalanine 4-monooxygenase [Marinoscillum sp. MHG1-6]|uniref:phenylalanine 4-monooxygenase n=1 Tax=Marinoscillum sp. MHG1-6 TaxID=2959627 RepID=UPI002157D88D|nr:phenylalanine 4-monooxygenase [Marinoscillum sp. MHG1-6]
MRQIYSNYNEEDFQVWKSLFERQMLNLPYAASTEFLEGLNHTQFVADRIPDFSETNEVLQQLTGWRLAVVPGIVPDYTFFELMSNKRFPATTWLRKMEELDYLEEPDMFHDVFAHVPLLTNQHFVDFLEELSKIGLEYSGNDYAIELLSRVYWFTVEFGLILEREGLRIYGAGILSSAGETKYCLSDEPRHHEFDVQQIIDTPYRKDVFQTDYFIIESYDQLYHSIPEVKRLLKQALEKRPEESVSA